MASLKAPNTTATYLPFNDERRVYTNDHSLGLYGCTHDGHNRVRILDIFDFPQRRWYQITSLKRHRFRLFRL